MYYKYGLTFSYSKPSIHDFPLKEGDIPIFKEAKDGSKYKAYAYYRKPTTVSITDEKVYHLEYLGRSNERR